jgi:vancomycin resistance protein YoaR
MNKDQNKITQLNYPKEIYLGILVFLIFYILFSVVLVKAYRGKILPQYYFLGVALNHTDVNNLEQVVYNHIQEVDRVTFFRPMYKQLPSEEVVVSTAGSLSLSPETFKNKEDYTFKGSWLESYKIWIGFFKTKVDLGEKFLVVDESKLRDEYLKKDTKVTTKGKGDARLDLTTEGQLGIREEVPEVENEFTNLHLAFYNTLKHNTFRSPIYPINLNEPKVTTSMWQNQLFRVQSLIKSGDSIDLLYKGVRLTLDSGLLPKLLSVSNDKLVFNPQHLSQILHESSLAAFEKRPVEPNFIYDQNTLRVLKFTKEIYGDRFETEKLAAELTKDFLDSPAGNKKVSEQLTLTTWESQRKLGELNPFGIQELLGTGWSSMRNSVPERYANITNGINKLNGLLVAPGQEFSTIGALSPFTIENGYVEGLAIKKKKILPEVGGGMCQVSTTLFRAAMNSGLKITDRSNHSVVVDYYNDPRNGLPGTDATIYEPAPDFKFKNDTQNYVLISTRVEAGGQIYFDFWGTRDGRIGSFTVPQVLSRTESTAEPVYDLSSSIPTGQVKCSGPFNGMSTVFTYVRTLKDGTIERVPYFSYYRPQGRNCLVGM